MKKLLIILSVIFLIAGNSIAQKVAYVDSEYILSKIPSYQNAQKQLDGFSETWQKEIENKYKEVDNLYKKFQQEKVLLSEDAKNKKEEEIVAKEKEAKELQKKYFGKEGQLYTKRQELVKPIQDEVYNAIKQLATEGNYDFVFDIVTGDILYANEKYNESDEVLKKLGF